MKSRPSLEEVRQILAEGKYGVIPVSAEIYSDSTTPMEVLRRLRAVSRHVYLLESAEADKRWGRYSFLGYDPVLSVSCHDGQLTVKTPLLTQNSKGDPRRCIRDIVEENKSPRFDYLPGFTGGLVGYFSYDYIKYSEPSLRLDARPPSPALPTAKSKIR